jgi:hypothetical protein
VTSPDEPEEPTYLLRWVITLPRPYPPITDRDCMPRGPAWTRRVARQIVPRTRIRDCCWHHSVNWHEASATAARIAQQVKREHISGEEGLADRASELIDAAGLPEQQRNAVRTLLSPTDGITRERLAGDRRRSYVNGRKRTYVMLESGVHRTVTVRWRNARPQAD